MSRKRGNRRAGPALLPRWLRPKLAPDQVRDLGLAHAVNFDAIASGQADEAILWQWVGGILTWSRAAELLEAGAPEMREQLELAARIIDRYGTVGRVEFVGDESRVAWDGVRVMDLLAEMVDVPTAVAAAEWSESRVNEMERATARR